MPSLEKKDLSSLYPKPRSFDEIEAERKLHQLGRRPNFVPAKIGAWTTTGFVTVLIISQIISHVMTDNLSSAGMVIFGVSFSILLSLIAGATLLYLYSLINGLAVRILASTFLLYVALLGVIIITGFVLTMLARARYDSLLAVATTLLFHFIATCLAVNFVIKHQK